MTVVSQATFIQANSHDARTLRRATLAALNSRGGVVPSTTGFTDLKVTQRGAGANMSVDVAEGTCYVTGTESNYQGLYHCDNQGIANVTITAANPTNPRRDLIVARVRDVEYGVAVTDEFTIEAIAGTPAASPADPTVPSNCIVLARVAVAAAATSITNANITDLRNNYAAVTGSSLIGNQQMASALGAVTPCLSTARPTIGVFPGSIIWETDTGRFQIWTGSSWTPMTGVGTLGSRIGCEARRTTTQSIPDITGTDILFDAEDFDSDSYHSTSSNTNRITIPTGLGGIYAVSFYIDAVGISAAQMFIIKNGTTAIRRKAVVAPLDTLNWTGYLAAGDYITAAVFQTSGGSYNLLANTTATALAPLSPSLHVYKVA